MTAGGQRFRPPQRLRRKSEFDRLFASGRRAGAEGLVVLVLENAGPETRLGISVSRRFGNAVVRNRARRLVREAFRRLALALPRTVDLVVLPQAGRFPDDLAAVQERLERALRRALKAPPGARPRPRSGPQGAGR